MEKIFLSNIRIKKKNNNKKYFAEVNFTPNKSDRQQRFRNAFFFSLFSELINFKIIIILIENDSLVKIH